MNETEKDNLLKSISDNIHNDIERILIFLNEEMKGHEISIRSDFDIESYASDFLHNQNLQVNISYVKFPEHHESSFYITLYKLFGPNEFDINIHIGSDSKHFFLIPEKLREALIASHAEGCDLEIIL